MSIPTHNVRKDGTLFRYCAICDSHYPSGSFLKHKMSPQHVASVKHRRAMQKWYAVNGR